MATFIYKAIDSTGKEISDKLIAADRASVIDQLFNRNRLAIAIGQNCFRFSFTAPAIFALDRQRLFEPALGTF